MTQGPEELVARLWERFRPLVLSRVDTLESYAADLAAADPAKELSRADLAAAARAEEAAHNLVGALGSYGRPHGSDLALQIETSLLSGAPEPAALAALVRELRQEVTR